MSGLWLEPAFAMRISSGRYGHGPEIESFKFPAAKQPIKFRGQQRINAATKSDRIRPSNASDDIAFSNAVISHHHGVQSFAYRPQSSERNL